ncbi:MAG: T9SS type A sorting domain-containing protein [Saprospiraceae bacterium]|nr:T9SS type A sorting domain-containing protein [Saprospiraceae bacterium]
MSIKTRFILLTMWISINSYSQQSITAGIIGWQQNDQVHQGSIGELAIAQTFDQPGIVLTQGYLQPIWKIMSTAQKYYFADVSITFYPNPFTTFLTLEMALNHKVKNMEISITDILGHQVFYKKLPLSLTSYSNNLDLHALPAGVYTLTTILNNIPHSSKLIQKF